jgi:hypothetical protein
MSDAGSSKRSGGSERAVRIARALTILLIGLALMMALTAADRALRLGLFRNPLTLQLAAAADAVFQEPVDRGQVQLDLGGTPVVIDMPLRYERSVAVVLILELDQMRAECERTIAHLKTLDYLEAEPEQQKADAARIASLWDAAQQRLAGAITLEPERARTVLAALGWPWIGDEAEALTANALDLHFAVRPAALRTIRPDAWHSILTEAEGERPWPEVAAHLARRYRLNEGQLGALQAHLCRTDVVRAFHSPNALRQAQRSLQRYAALTPAQMQTVLAMAGALELLDGGKFAFPPLIDLLERDPSLGLPLLHECVRRTGVRGQAERAAAQLGGPASADAEDTLIALGPFGADAVQAALAHGLISSAAERVQAAIGASWPGGAALEVLGNNPALWRRWYGQARQVL